jgi:hypothetical protein
VNKGVSHGPGGFVIDFTHHQGGLFHGMPGHVDGGPQTAKARTVRWRDLNEGGINSDNAGLNQPGNFGKRTGDHVDPAGGDFFTGNPTGEKGFQSIFMVLVLRNGDGGTKTHQLNELQDP